MMITAEKRNIVKQLRKQLLEIQGFKPSPISQAGGFGLGPLESCFPNSTFPVGTIHEFIAENQEETAASEGFISGLLAKLMENSSTCLWISRDRKLFPPAMQAFNVQPEQIIFIDLNHKKEILWVMEEALKCEGLAGVIAEISDIDFSQSRRLQLAVEKSRVTGILLRKEPKNSLSATACTVRWQVKPQVTEPIDGLPGVGNPRWEISLLKVRNGHTGKFKVEWASDRFIPLETSQETNIQLTKKAG